MDTWYRAPRLTHQVIRRITGARLPQAAALLLVVLTLGACSSQAGTGGRVVPPAPSGVLRIYSSLPMKGHDLAQANQIRQAIDLAIEHSWAGQRANWKFEHVALDGGSEESGEWSPEIERVNAQQAANDPSAIAYIGPYTSGATGISLPVTNQAGLLQLGAVATWPGLTLSGWNPGEPGSYFPSGQRNYVRLSVPDSRQADAAVQWAWQEGVRSALALDDGSSYSQGLARQFEQAATQAGIRVDPGVSLRVGSNGEIQLSLPATLPDALFYAPSSTAFAATVASALSAQASHARVFSTDTALSNQFIDAAGGTATGWYFLSNGGTAPQPSAAWNDFATRFQARYGATPGRAAANAYDLARLVIEAGQAAGRDRDTVLTRVMHASSQGATGPVGFDSAGDSVDWSIDGYKLAAGRFVLERSFEGTPGP